ncbi:MAG: hypothetical protein JNM72_08920, partial [Deltaproteobacteria bacterium]|nr:hypothetical protein [Deltaproteobacteria bacterium]
MSKPPPPRPPSATPAAPAAGPAGAVERPALKTPAQPGVAGVNPAAMAPGGAPPPGGRVPDGFRVSAPTVSMPRGGGGLASIGEKFEANPVTGAGSYTIPLPASPGRAGQPGPGLALRYSSGGGNGPFGMGWSLDLPSIRRKTERGLPRYRDSGDEADVFVLAGAEDLVPHLSPDGSGGWVPSVRTWSDGVHTWTVTRYRPRVEAQSQLIERFSRPGAAPFWRTVGADNTRRLFGWSPQARVVDPDDPRRVFEWLLEEEADERGHVVSYQYDLDDGADARGIFEAGRAREGERVTYRHLRRVSYGNSAPFQNPDRPAGLVAPDTWSAAGRGGHFHLHLLFDYGDIDAEDPGLTPSAPWPRRVDPFSTFRSGFDIRCARRCARVLMLHHFDGLRMVDDAPLPVVVRSLQLGYEDDPAGARLLTATLRGWRWADGAGGSPGAYSTLDSPALTFGYTQAVIDHAVHEVEGTADLPGGVDRRLWRWVDLDADGLPGLLAESGGQWLYKRNEGGRLAPARVLTSRPTLSLADPQVRIADLDGGGELGFVLTRRELAGTLHRADDGTWGALRPFRSLPTAALRNEGVRLIDLDGDGRADLMVTEDDAIIWYPSAGRDGWGPSWLRNRMSRDEALAPRVLWQNDGEGLFLADMTGDGLTDIVRVRNSTVDYWPNRGYGRFGARVRMGEAPSLSPSRHDFDPRRVRLADVDGAGPADLLYIGADGVRVWRNLSGNRFGAPQTIRSLPCAHDPDGVQVTDLRGDGTATLLWATSLPRDAGKPLRAVHLMAAGKPYLLASVDNGRGRVTRFSYAPSTQFYLADRRAGRPWATRLPFPVQVLTRVESRDHITGWKFVQTYSYHHGTYDGAEREFRGFGLVVQRDAESFADFEDPSVANAELVTHQPPVCTKTWFHTGVWRKGKALAAAFATEWWQGDAEVSTAGAAAQLALPRVEDETGGVFATHPLRRPLTDAEHREAHRALKGQLLRQEVYAEDGSPSASVPYQVTTHSYRVRRVQAGARPGTAVFRSFSEQVLQRDYDRIANDPRTRHTCTLEVDAEGFVRSQAVLSYPRRAARSPSAEQAVLDVILSETTPLHQTDQVGYAGGASSPHGGWHLGLPVRARSFTLTGPLGWTDLALATPEAIRATVADEDLVEVDFSATPDPAVPTVRLLGDQRTRYLDAAATTPSPLPYGEVGPRAIAYDAHVLAMTSALVDQVYDSRITLTALLADTGCVSLPTGASGAADDGQVWLPSGRLVLDPDRFYLPLSHIDPFGATTTLTWDALGFGLAAVEDPLGYETTANLDLQALAPTTTTDKHGTTEAVLLDPHGRVLAMCRSSVTSTGTEGETDFAAPTTRFFYDDHRFADDGLPNRAVVEARERHGASPTYQREVAYFDGGGGVVQVQGRAAPGPAPARDSAGALVFDGGALVMAEADPRYVGSGRVQVDNKGNPIKQYEPFFSSTEEYESEADVVEWGVSPVFAYDPLGRNTQVTLPDGNVRTVRYNPWRVEQRDEEDNAATPTSAIYTNTPGVTHLDAQGRPYRSDAYLRAASSPFEADGTTPFDPDTSPDVLRTTVQYDVQGNPTAVVDPRGNTIQVQVFDLVGRPLFTGAADEGYTPSNGQGEARVLADAAGQPVHLWRSGNTAGITNERKTSQAYDLVRRPTVQTLTDGTATPRVTELRSYGELGGAPTTGRLAGRLFRLFDTAGLMEVSAYDLRGAPITLRRQVLADLTSAADWSTLVSATTVSAQNTATASLLDARSWPLDRSYDALGRLLWEDAPDADSAGANRSRTTPSYDVGGRLVRVEATVRGATTATVFVSDIEYNARGQRESITYGEGATSSTTTTYTYDPQRLWLTRLRTVRA